MKLQRILPAILSLTALVSAHAATVTWNGGNYTWTQPDSDSFDATYNSGDSVVFGNTGITDGTSGKTQITISGNLTAGDVTFNQTGARTGGATGSPGAIGFNYLLVSGNNTANVINSTGNLTLNGGNTIFRAVAPNVSYTNSFAGALNYNGGVMLGISSQDPGKIAIVQVGSLAAPTAGNSIVFNAITSANSNSAGAAWSATTNRVVVTGSKPSVTNGMVSPGLQFYTGGNNEGHFMTFSGDNLIPFSAYTNYSGDWSGAGSTEVVNLTAATTLTGSGVLNIHALRIASGNQNLGGRTINLGSGGLIIATNITTSNGTLDFGSNPGFIGAYNAAGQGEISARLSGTGGLTFLGSTQGLRLINNSNDFTGGLFINGGSIILGNGTTTWGATAANGNDVVVNDLGSLAVNVPATGGAVIGGLSGDGDVAPQYQANGDRTITISPSSGTHAFNGTIRNGANGRVLSVIKSGAGTQVFGAGITANYTGTTTVNAGTLLVNGDLSAATGAVTVASGATLGGSGIIGGDTTINGILAPGNSPGLLTFNSTLTLNTGSTTLMEVGATTTRGGTFDAVDVTGALTYGGNLTLNMTQTFGIGTYSWNLFDFGSQSGDFANVLLTGSYAGSLSNSGGTWSLTSGSEAWTFTQSDGVLALTVIPEPATWVLLAVSLTAMVIFRRRRRVC